MQSVSVSASVSMGFIVNGLASKQTLDFFFFPQSLPSLELYITVTSSRTLNLLIAYSHKRTVLGAEIEYGNTIPEITVTGYQLIAPAARPRFSLFASPALSLICIQHHSIHPSTTTTATNTFLHFGNSS